jgi:CheY-like chemotaxis protein
MSVAAVARKRVILIIDDDREVRAALEESLGDEGYAVVSASDGDEALSRLRGMAEKPDVLILDLMMPKLDGWQFRQQQLSDPELAGIATVVLTADQSAQPESIRGERVVFVRKPVHLDKLLDAIERVGTSG